MNIENINSKFYKKIFDKDSNDREINIYKLDSVQICNDGFYPNCYLYSNKDDKIYNPIFENIMSLKKVERQIKVDFESKNLSIKNGNFFYFIYNTDNYYHFVYDTLPYLISFLKLKKNIKNIKLLMNYPNFQSKKFYKFVEEFLEILDIKSNDIEIVNPNIKYSKVYISSSYTHGIDSEKEPRSEIYKFYKKIIKISRLKSSEKNYPSKIYISRRTWISENIENIGTNYTLKRKCENEDYLVEYLQKLGYKEVFTEKLSTIEKINLFSNVKNVVGLIGGGLCNVLFSKPNTKLLCIVSPTFLEVNNRFKYSLDNVKTEYFEFTNHIDTDEFKRYMRVTDGKIIGEVEEIFNDSVTISYTDNFVAGWNSELKLKKINLKKSNLIKLDNGLNSPFLINIKKLSDYKL
jgi:capsular polysaccharide biosynthesis protein